jgi:hypothetical protein
MKRAVLLCLFFGSIVVHSQTILTEKKMNLTFSGFVKSDFITDTRRNAEAVDGLYTLWPAKPEYDANGEDLNAQPSTRMFTISSRFATRLSGVEFGRAKAVAYVEIDFTGGDAANSIRLRHAYSRFDWPKTSLLFGRTWHPTFIEKVFPGVMALNTGVPFQVFNRSPQLRVTHHLSCRLDLIAAAVYQINYINYGPDPVTGASVASSRYQRDAMIPNFHLQLQYFDDQWVAGAGVDWKTIQPRSYTIGREGKRYVTREKLPTLAALAYAKFTSGKLEVKAKTMFGQNVSESLLPGGYAIASVDPETGHETYTPTNHLFSFVNLIYGKKWKTGLFAGYMTNLGTSVNPVGTFYARGADVGECWRISPLISWQHTHLMVSFEPEITSVTYGTIDRTDRGRIRDAEAVTNYRNLLTLFYFF